jgi:hypothetical protein
LSVLATPAVIALTGSVVAAVVPGVVLGGLWLLCTASLGAAVPTLLFLVLTLENPQERPGGELVKLGWHPPLASAGRLLFTNLDTLLPGSGMPFSLLDAAIAILCVRAILNALDGARQNAASRGYALMAPPALFLKALLLSLGTLVAFEFYGIATHGDFKNSLWQIRELLGMLGVAFITASAGSSQLLRRLRSVVLTAAMIKAVQTIYAYFLIARPQGVKAAYIGTHSDSTLYVWALIILLAERIEARSAAHRSWQVGAGGLLFMATVANNRRLAWVGLLGALIWAVATSRPETKRRIYRGLILMSPLIMLYIGVGLKSKSSLFFPVSAVNSVISQDDSSSESRGIENTNLLATFRAHPLIGSGFGHEYIELVKGDDISDVFVLYRYLPHNSLLGLWAFMGTIGFGGFWLFFVVSVNYAATALRFELRPDLRAAAIWSVGGLIAFMVQAQGDLGLQSWIAVAIAGTCCGVASTLGSLEADQGPHRTAPSGFAAASTSNAPPSILLSARA